MIRWVLMGVGLALGVVVGVVVRDVQTARVVTIGEHR